MFGIVLVAPFDRDTRTVDRVTGRLGWGHVAIAGGEEDEDGRILVVDASTLTKCVSRRPLLDVLWGARFTVLPVESPEEVYARALDRIGEPYDFRQLVGFAPRPGHWTCSGLAHACLGIAERTKIRPWREGWTVAPNDIARALGA